MLSGDETVAGRISATEEMMISNVTRRGLLRAAAAVTAISGFTIIETPAARAAGKPYRIALSNSFIGNKWRIEMENVYKAALQMEPYKSDVIPRLADQNLCAHSRSPMDMMRHGWASSLFHVSQQ